MHITTNGTNTQNQTNALHAIASIAKVLNDIKTDNPSLAKSLEIEKVNAVSQHHVNDLFDTNNTPGANNYANSLIANFIVRTELSAGILESMGEVYKDKVESLRGSVAKLRSSVSSLSRAYNGEDRAAFQELLHDNTGQYLKIQLRNIDQLSTNLGLTLEVSEKLKSALTFAYLKVGDFFREGLDTNGTRIAAYKNSKIPSVDGHEHVETSSAIQSILNSSKVMELLKISDSGLWQNLQDLLPKSNATQSITNFSNIFIDPRSNIYSISMIAESIVRAELSAAIFESKSGFELHAQSQRESGHVLRQLAESVAIAARNVDFKKLFTDCINNSLNSHRKSIEGTATDLGLDSKSTEQLVAGVDNAISNVAKFLRYGIELPTRSIDLADESMGSSSTRILASYDLPA